MRLFKRKIYKKKPKFRISVSFWLSFLVSFFLGNGYLFLLYTLAIVLHELSHIFIAKKLGYELSLFELSIFGASMNLDTDEFYAFDEFKIALAGPIASLSIFILLVFCWWMFPAFYIYTFDFAIVNLFVFVTNILPLYSLDGGRIVASLIEKYKSRKLGIKVVKIIGMVVSIVLFLLFLISCFFSINFSLGVFALFLFFSSTSDSGGSYKKISVSSKLEKLNRGQALETKTFIVSEDARLLDLYRKLSFSALSCFIVSRNGKASISFDEVQLTKYIENYPITKRVKEII